MEIGLHKKLPFEEYAKMGGLRKSGLWPLVNGTPADYRYKMDNPKPPTDAMKLGTAVHDLVLEPEEFLKRNITGGPINPKTSKPYGRDTKKFAEWEAATGKVAWPRKDWDKINAMAESVMRHDGAAHLLGVCETEVSALWKDPYSGRLLQARYDMWIAGIIGDLKTTRDVGRRAFRRQAEDMGYFMQIAMYWDGAQILTGETPKDPHFVIVETEPPYKTAVRKIDIEDTSLALGRVQYQYALDQLKKYEALGEWPAYPGVETMEMSKWEKEKIDRIVGGELEN